MSQQKEAELPARSVVNTTRVTRTRLGIRVGVGGPGRSRTAPTVGRRRGALSFEWTVLITLLVIGVVGGLTAARDAMVSELYDVSGAVDAVDQSFRGFGVRYRDREWQR